LSSFGVLTVSMFSEAGIQRPVMKQAPKSARILAGVPETVKAMNPACRIIWTKTCEFTSPRHFSLVQEYLPAAWMRML
jgi:hypothetical protein